MEHLQHGKRVIIYNYRGDKLFRIGRIVEMRDTEENPIVGGTRNTVMTRGRYLLVVWDEQRKVTRSYYLAHCEYVVRLTFARWLYHSLLVLLRKRQMADT